MTASWWILILPTSETSSHYSPPSAFSNYSSSLNQAVRQVMVSVLNLPVLGSFLDWFPPILSSPEIKKEPLREPGKERQWTGQPGPRHRSSIKERQVVTSVLVRSVVTDFMWCGCHSSAVRPQLCRSRNLILSGHLELTGYTRTSTNQLRGDWRINWNKEHAGITSSTVSEHVRKPIKTTILLGKHWIEVGWEMKGYFELRII